MSIDQTNFEIIFRSRNGAIGHCLLGANLTNQQEFKMLLYGSGFVNMHNLFGFDQFLWLQVKSLKLLSPFPQASVRYLSLFLISYPSPFSGISAVHRV